MMAGCVGRCYEAATPNPGLNKSKWNTEHLCSIRQSNSPTMAFPPFPPVDRPPPTTAAIVIATAILAGVAGFFIGQGASLGLFSSSSSSPSRSASSKPRKSWPNSYDVKIHADSSDDGGGDAEADSEEDEDEDGGPLATFEGNTDEVKLVLVVRTDLGMGKGEFLACGRRPLGLLSYVFLLYIVLFVVYEQCWVSSLQCLNISVLTITLQQARSLHSAPMPLSLATNISSQSRPIHLFFGAGNRVVRQRLPFR